MIAAGYTARRTERDSLPPSRVLTGVLMGDPVGDRMERDREARLRLGIIADDAPAISAPVLAVLRALENGPLGCSALGDAMGCCRSTASKQARHAVALDLVDREGKGHNVTYRLARDGRAALEAQPQ